MPATGRRRNPARANKLRLMQTTIGEDSMRRIHEISEETYATPSAVVRRIIDTYFRMVDEKQKRIAQRAVAAEKNNKSEAA